MPKAITAAEFKRRFMNRKARNGASLAVDIRVEINKPGTSALAADKKRLRQQWLGRDSNPGEYHRPANLSARPLSLGRNRSHLVVSF
jgi:hypothetical protein